MRVGKPRTDPNGHFNSNSQISGLSTHPVIPNRENFSPGVMAATSFGSVAAPTGRGAWDCTEAGAVELHVTCGLVRLGFFPSDHLPCE